MKLMILAAGIGSRLQPMTLRQHKACVPVLNVPVLCFGLNLFRDFPLKGMVANLCHLPEQVVQTLKAYAPMPVSFSDERKQILGSGGALVKAKAFLENKSKNFFTLNADTIFLPEEDHFMEKMAERHLQSQALASLLCIPGHKVDESFSKIWTSKTEPPKVFSIGLKPPEKDPKEFYQNWHFTGIALFSERIFKYLPPSGPSYFFQDGLIPAIQQGETVEVYPSCGLWMEMGRPGDLLLSSFHLMRILQNEEEPYKSYLQKLVPFFEPECVFKTSKEALLLYHRQSCSISKKARFKGKVVLGKNSSVGENVYLENVVVQDNCQLSKGTQLKNSLITSMAATT